MAENVDGDLSLGGGWWLRLPRSYLLDYDDEGSVVVHRETVRIAPQVVSFDPANMNEPVLAVVAGIIEDTIADADGALAGIGEVAGEGWRGHACEGLTDREAEEFRLVASLGASGTILNLDIRYLHAHTGDEARWLVEHVAHRPDTTELTDTLAEADVRLSVPSESWAEGWSTSRTEEQ